MAWIDDKLLDLTQSPAVAAAVGSLLSLRWMPMGSTWMSKLFSLACGFSLAVYVIPWLTSAASVESIKATLAFSFLGGFLGLLILSRLWDYVATTQFGELLNSFFRRA